MLCTTVLILGVVAGAVWLAIAVTPIGGVALGISPIGGCGNTPRLFGQFHVIEPSYHCTDQHTPRDHAGQ